MIKTSPFAVPLREQLISVVNGYHRATGLPISVLSWRIHHNSSRFQTIMDGGDVSTSKFEEVMHWFSDRWPEGEAWPEGVARPTPQPVPERGEVA